MESPTFLHDLVESTKADLVVGETWCIVSMEWWKQVLEALAEGLENADLPDVDNLNLCDNTNQEEGENDAVLRPGLKEDIDYKLVPESTWEMLHERFGGGPRFRRQVIEIRGQPQVEIYLYSLRVTYMKRPEVIDTEDIKSTIPGMTALKFEVSRKSTIQELRNDFFEAFEISPETACKLALFNYLDDCLGDILEDFIDDRDGSKTTWRDNGKLATVHSARLVDSQALLIDNRPESVPDPEIEETSSSESLSTATTSGVEAPKGHPTLKEILMKPSAFPRGIVGLRNLGNTCFMNSALQCLSATEELMDFFVTGRFLDEINETNPLGKGGELAVEFGKLMVRMWNGKEGSIIPRDFKWMLGNFAKRFDDFSQQDSQELLSFLLDGLHEDCNRILKKPSTPAVDVTDENDQRLIEAADLSWQYYKQRNDSAIVDLFQAQLKSRLECADCGYTSITFDPFMYLSLPIPTDSIRTKDVLLCGRPGLLRCAVQLPRTALMSQVKQQLQELTGVSASRIVLADVHASKVHRKFNNFDRFDSVSNSDNLVAFELQYDIKKPLVGKVIVPVLQRVLRPEWNAQLDRWSYSATCISTPTFVLVDKHITYGDLFAALKRQIAVIADMKDASIASKPFPFTISKVKKENGATIHHLEEYLGGSSTDRPAGDDGKVQPTPTDARNLHIVIAPGDTLSVDWDLSLCTPVSPAQPQARSGPRTFPVKNHPKYDETIALGTALASKAVTLEDCFKAFVKPERLDGSNSWRCPVCKVERDASKAISIWTLPDLLVVHLKRFTETIYTRNKLSNKIEYPVYDLDLAPFLADRPEGCTDSRVPQSTKYELYAVSNHYGNLNGGHYTATTRNFMTGEWREYDDSDAHPVADKDIVSAAAYVLFYRRIPSAEEEEMTAKL